MEIAKERHSDAIWNRLDVLDWSGGVVLIKKELVTIPVGELKVKANSVTKEEPAFEEQLS